MRTAPDEVTKPTTDVAFFLRERHDALVADAADRLTTAPFTHYRDIGPDAIEERLSRLLDVIIAATQDHRLDGAALYASGLAKARQGAGFRLDEVQAALNALEATLWGAITGEMSPTAQVSALEIVSTVFGAIKDRIGCSYSAQAAATKPSSIDVSRLFDGTEANLSGDMP